MENLAISTRPDVHTWSGFFELLWDVIRWLTDGLWTTTTQTTTMKDDTKASTAPEPEPKPEPTQRLEEGGTNASTPPEPEPKVSVSASRRQHALRGRSGPLAM